MINGACVCPAPMTAWDSQSKSCGCPANTYGPNCNPCALPRYWDQNSNSCVCQSPKNYWNSNSQQC